MFFLIISVVFYFIMVFYNYKNFKTGSYDKAAAISSSLMFPPFLVYFLKFSLHWGWLYSCIVSIGITAITLMILKKLSSIN